MILINVIILLAGSIFDFLFGWSARTPYDHSQHNEPDKNKKEEG